MNWRRLPLLFALVSAIPAYADGISGTYVAKGSNSAFLVQIVETAGGQLTGRYEQTVMEPGGTVKQSVASITGASDGHTVVVTIKPTEILSQSITASGTAEGLLLHLSGGSGSTKVEWSFSRSDEASYRSQVASLVDQAHRVIEARAEADRLTGLTDLTANMLAYSAAADAQLKKFPPIEQRYRALTEWMSAALGRQQSIFGGGQARLARGQVGLEINNAGMEGAQLHNGIQSADQEMGAKLQPLLKSTGELGPRCHSTAEGGQLHFACRKYFNAAAKFKGSMERLAKAFEQAEKVWVEERRKQEMIIQASIVSR